MNTLTYAGAVRAIAAVLCLCACGAPASSPDAATPDAELPLLPMSYDLRVCTNELAALGAKHVVELRYDDRAVASMTLAIEQRGCLDPMHIPIAREQGGVDVFCDGDRRCGVRLPSTSPLASHLACVPAGAKAEDAPCTFVDDPAGAYDDCAKGLYCVDGCCRRSCSPNPTLMCPDTCEFVPGYPPEVRICR